MKQLLILTALLIAGIFANAQKVELLYFKANLPCCPARACNALESDIQSILEESFDSETVIFKQVLLADASNKSLVDKYNAKSQTVVLVKNSGGEEKLVDASSQVRAYMRSNDKAKLKAELTAMLNELEK